MLGKKNFDDFLIVIDYYLFRVLLGIVTGTLVDEGFSSIMESRVRMD